MYSSRKAIPVSSEKEEKPKSPNSIYFQGSVYTPVFKDTVPAPAPNNPATLVKVKSTLAKVKSTPEPTYAEKLKSTLAKAKAKNKDIPNPASPAKDISSPAYKAELLDILNRAGINIPAKKTTSINKSSTSINKPSTSISNNKSNTNTNITPEQLAEIDFNLAARNKRLAAKVNDDTIIYTDTEFEAGLFLTNFIAKIYMILGSLTENNIITTIQQQQIFKLINDSKPEYTDKLNCTFRQTCIRK